jgi:nitrogen regulatory protein PII
MRKITLFSSLKNLKMNMAREKLTLPFEVTYSEKPSKKSRTMKRLAVVLKPENVDEVVASLKASGLEATIYDVKGAGKEKERVTSGRGMGTVELAYTTRKVVATVVNADDVGDVVEGMKKALGGQGGAVVMVSPVDDLVRL